MKVRQPWMVLLTVLLLMCSGPLRAVRAEQGGRSSAPPRQTAGAPQAPEALVARSQATTITVRPTMVARGIEELAGQHVRIVNARVVGLFDPRAFLIEPAGASVEAIGQRDRILVLIDGASLRVPAETVVASTVVVVGVARTLLGLKMSAEVQWPAPLDRALADRLDVRAAVLATSVQTAEGIELTQSHK